jgi:hypothetical protein
MRLALAAAGLTAATGLALLAAGPAQAAVNVPKVDLRTTLTGPLYGSGDPGASETTYALKVANSLPDATADATGVVILTTAFECPRGDLVYLHCTPYQSVTRRLRPIAPGRQYADMITLDLPNSRQEVWFRLAADVTHVDQVNLGPAPGACVYGQHASDICAGSTLDLLP